jgi:LysM repeat protein
MNKQKISCKIIIALLSICTLLFSNISTVLGAEAFPGSYQYTVKTGDTIYIIAGKCGITVDALKVINGINTNLIYPGQVFNIPSNTSKIFGRYTVIKGDTLYKLALKYGVTVNALKYANSLTTNVIMPGQVLTIPFMQFKPLTSILSAKGVSANAKIDIFVDKSEHTLLLFSNGKWLKTYHIELGIGGLGDKQVLGDRKTPEGTFYACQKTVVTNKELLVGTRFIRVSYPNVEDAGRGLNKGLINKDTYNAIVTAVKTGSIPPQNTSLGGGIGIHGGTMPGFDNDWTYGCVGLTNADVEDLYDYIKVGSKIIIQK